MLKWFFGVAIVLLVAGTSGSVWFTRRRRAERKMLYVTLLKHPELDEFFKNFKIRKFLKEKKCPETK